jgi:plastocyanin
MKRYATLFSLNLLLLALAACGPSTSSGGTSSTQQPAVTLGATTFATNAITISKGQTITFTDDPTNGAMHILVVGKNGVPQTEAGAPDLGGTSGQTMTPGQSWTTPAWNTPGTYYVTCTVHPIGMTMVVTVTA